MEGTERPIHFSGPLTHVLTIPLGHPDNPSEGIEPGRRNDAVAVLKVLHLDRVETGNPYPIGLALEGRDPSGIGPRVNVFGTEEGLKALLGKGTHLGRTLARTRIVHSLDVRLVPPDASHMIVARSRKDCIGRGGLRRKEERDRRRRAAGIGGVSEEKMRERRERTLADPRNAEMLPMLSLPSSKGRVFLFLKVERADRPVAGMFTSHGLSVGGSTVPAL